MPKNATNLHDGIDVLHVIPTLAVAGAEQMLTALVTARRAQPLRQAVVYFLPGDDLAATIRAAGVPVYWAGMPRQWQVPGAVPRLAWLIRQLRPKAVQTWAYYTDLLALWALEWAGRRRATRLYWGIRCSALDFAQFRWALEWTVRACARRSRRPDAIIANSYAGREAHLALGYDDSAFFVIPNGIDVSRYRHDPQARIRLRQELGVGASEPVVTNIARVDPIKDHRLLVSVAGAMPHIRFLAAGRGTETLPGPPNLLRLGLRRDVPHLLAASDAFLLTSANGEGFPNVVAEAMAAGLPVISTDVGDARRMVGDAGTVVAPGDRAAIVAAITELLALPDAVRRARGERARMRAQTEFSLQAYVAAFDALHRAGTPPAEPAGPAPGAADRDVDQNRVIVS